MEDKKYQKLSKLYSIAKKKKAVAEHLLIKMTEHRNKWREYAYGRGKRPDDFLSKKRKDKEDEELDNAIML